MPKAVSPVRLQAELMQAATRAGQRQHRSAAEQIEYWASIGRRLANTVNPDTITAIHAGLVRLKIEPVEAPVINPEAVFEALEQDRESGRLPASVTSSTVRYQASKRHPGLLEQISPDGRVKVGQFHNGKFSPQQDSMS